MWDHAIMRHLGPRREGVGFLPWGLERRASAWAGARASTRQARGTHSPRRRRKRKLHSKCSKCEEAKPLFEW